MTPVKRSPQRKKNKNVDDKTENKIPNVKPTRQTNNKTEAEERMDAEPNNNSKKCY